MSKKSVLLRDRKRCTARAPYIFGPWPGGAPGPWPGPWPRGGPRPWPGGPQTLTGWGAPRLWPGPWSGGPLDFDLDLDWGAPLPCPGPWLGGPLNLDLGALLDLDWGPRTLTRGPPPDLDLEGGTRPWPGGPPGPWPGPWLEGPPCGQTHKVKTLPSRHTPYAGGNQLDSSVRNSSFRMCGFSVSYRFTRLFQETWCYLLLARNPCHRTNCWFFDAVPVSPGKIFLFPLMWKLNLILYPQGNFVTCQRLSLIFAFPVNKHFYKTTQT